ncbi:uncharacterized protein mtg [Anabrus simplex]|uniref:uncharacterized protein mtg n=1 Tax=Anabrus simplex TaxID=316456 RepID=UPI0035A377FB
MKELLLIAVFGCGLLWQFAGSTCVVNSDFGFILNCAVKKSGIFRVRNLGGVKGYVGVGFSVGDEQLFNESLSNLESSKRRSVATARSSNIPFTKTTPSKVPPFKPIPPQKQNVTRPSRLAQVPPFQALPASITKVANDARVTTAFRDSLNSATHHFQVRKDVLVDSGASPNTIGVATNSIAVGSSSPPLPAAGLGVVAAPSSVNVVALPPSSAAPPAPPKRSVAPAAPSANLVAAALQSIAKATNLSVETVAAALTRTTQSPPAIPRTTAAPPTTSTTPNPLAGISKVMNAPKEYYPVAYDKDFDDNFASRVELPDTSFYCGDQKHFPGLYADEDLGCMVFHVCALTDDGLIMKSFLCPESTLFDQTILKCNWWFYVDCKNSKKLYDSNIPISKSYQLMKALAFFSTYKKS